MKAAPTRTRARCTASASRAHTPRRTTGRRRSPRSIACSSGNPDHPAAVIARGDVLASSGRIVPGSALGNEVRAQLDASSSRVKPPGPSSSTACRRRRSRSRTSRSRASTSRADDPNAAQPRDQARDRREPRRAALRRGDRRHAGRARRSDDRAHAADPTLKAWPASRRARIALAADRARAGTRRRRDRAPREGDRRRRACPRASPRAATPSSPTGDAASAALDFDAALKKLPTPRAGDRSAARGSSSRPATRRCDASGSPSVTTPRARAQRSRPSTRRRSGAARIRRAREGQAAAREARARASGPEVARAQLELARIYRDIGEYSPRPRRVRGGDSRGQRRGAARARAPVDRGSQAARRTRHARCAPQGSRRAPDATARDRGARARGCSPAITPVPSKLLDARRQDVGRRALEARSRARPPRAAQVAVRRRRGSPGARARHLRRRRRDVPARRRRRDCRGDSSATRSDKLAPERLKGRPELRSSTASSLLAAQGRRGRGRVHAARRTRSRPRRRRCGGSRRPTSASRSSRLNRNNAAEAIVLLEIVMRGRSVDRRHVHLRRRPRGDPAARGAEGVRVRAEGRPAQPRLRVRVARRRHARAQLGDKRTLTDAIARLQNIAPSGDELKELQALRGK